MLGLPVSTKHYRTGFWSFDKETALNYVLEAEFYLLQEMVLRKSGVRGRGSGQGGTTWGQVRQSAPSVMRGSPWNQDCSTIVFLPYRDLMEYVKHLESEQRCGPAAVRALRGAPPPASASHLGQGSWTTALHGLGHSQRPPAHRRVPSLSPLHHGPGYAGTRTVLPEHALAGLALLMKGIGACCPTAALHTASTLENKDLTRWFATLTVNPSEASWCPRLLLGPTTARL
jgi:hypothetical protein